MQKLVAERLLEYYRCPEQFAQFVVKPVPAASRSFFRLGEDTLCFGRAYEHGPAKEPNENLPDAMGDVAFEDGCAYLPFDPTEIADNLLRERYIEDSGKSNDSLTAKLYYLIRPFLPVKVRRHLQRIRLSGWEKRPFPRWPVDFSVDDLSEQLLLLSMRAAGLEEIPFIWFWPHTASSCVLMTHDVETEDGRRFCKKLMDINDSFGIKSSFQVVPEERYQVTQEYLSSIRDRGFEVAVHDLNHDGRLYRDHEQFLSRVAKINAYGREFQAGGFRAGVLYRNQAWFDAFQFSYDMSVPNVAHLDPQRGGCCTAMPYFIGNLLELPVTTIQDYTLFHILNDYSIDIWKRQTNLILKRQGLMSFIVHPDYILEEREQSIYKELLAHLVSLREKAGAWITTPAQVNKWWRQRAEMKIVSKDGKWQIEGQGKERACVAYARESKGQLVFTLRAESGEKMEALSQ